MTRVRWTTNAADDLARIVNYIRSDNPEAPRRVAKTIFDGVSALQTFPMIDLQLDVACALLRAVTTLRSSHVFA